MAILTILSAISLVFQLFMAYLCYRNGDEFYWYFVIMGGGPIGAAVYLFVEVIPFYLSLGRSTKKGFTRDEAGRMRELELTIKTNRVPANLRQLAELYIKKEDYKTANEYLIEVMNYYNSDVALIYSRALCCVSLGNYDEGIQLIEDILNKNPRYKNGEARLLLARAYEKSNRYDSAVENYRLTIKENHLLPAHYLLGKVYIKQGKKEDAIIEIKKIVETIPLLTRYQLRDNRYWIRKAKIFLAENKK